MVAPAASASPGPGNPDHPAGAVYTMTNDPAGNAVVVESALASAKNLALERKLDVDPNLLVVAKATVNEGPTLRRYIPRAIAERYTAFPLFMIDNVLTVAMAVVVAVGALAFSPKTCRRAARRRESELRTPSACRKRIATTWKRGTKPWSKSRRQWRFVLTTGTAWGCCSRPRFRRRSTSLPRH